MKPILVGLDGSELAEQGLVLAANLAEALDANVIAARVVPENWSGRAYDPDLLHRLEEADEKDAASYLAQIASRLREDRVQVQTRLLHGHPARELVAAARQDECSLIVVTSHGMSGLGSRVFGSVAQKVLADAPCPVVVVPCSESDLLMEEELEEQVSDESALERIGARAKQSGVIVGVGSILQFVAPSALRPIVRCDEPWRPSTRTSSRVSPFGSCTAPGLKTLFAGYGQ